jgi:cytoskeletal protein CcmA (bactofilin family)
MTHEEISTVIGQGVFVEGDITVHSSIRIKGFLKGNLSSTGTVVVLSGGKIDGEVIAKNVILHSTINGNLTATDTASFEQGASLNGDLYTAKVTLAEGSKFNGKCTMIKRKDIVIDPETKKLKLVDLTPEEMLTH